jgi:hypothetical protein
MIPSGEPRGEIVLYETADGRTRVECRFADETLWLSQALIAELFQVGIPTVNEHLAGIYGDGEVLRGPTVRNFRIGRRDVARQIEHYNLDAILAVGYRVRADRSVQFRRWATERLREFLVKGFVLDDERLRHPAVEGLPQPGYFDALGRIRVRPIRRTAPGDCRGGGRARHFGCARSGSSRRVSSRSFRLTRIGRLHAVRPPRHPLRCT